MADKEVEAAVTVEIEEGGAGVPPGLMVKEAARARDVRERPVAVVVVKHVLAVIGDEQIEKAVVIVVARAHPLTPPMFDEAGLGCNVRKGTIAIVLVEMIGRLLAAREVDGAPAVDDEDVRPFVIVVVEDCRAPARRGEQKILRASPNNGGTGQARPGREVHVMWQVGAHRARRQLELPQELGTERRVPREPA